MFCSIRRITAELVTLYSQTLPWLCHKNCKYNRFFSLHTILKFTRKSHILTDCNSRNACFLAFCNIT